MGKTIFVHTSYDDLLSSFKCSIAGYTVEMLEENMKYEQEHQKRKTVINLLTRAIRMKKLNAKSL